MTQPHVERLANGFTTVAVEMPARHLVLVTLLVRAGSRFEAPTQNGISHFLEHMLFRGNATHGDARGICEAFEEVGGLPNAATGVEATEFYFLCHPDRLEQGLRALAALVRGPTLPEIERERSIILDEISYDYNEQGELIHLGALGAKLLWPEHPLGQSVLGTLETVGGFAAPALHAHHARHYRPGHMVLGLAGRVEAAQAHALGEACFGDWEAPALPLPAALLSAPNGADGPHTRLVPDVDNQFHLQLSFPAAGYAQDEDIPLSFLARLLDDGPTTLLQRRIREELGLAYHIGADYTGYQDVGHFDIATSVKAERLPDLLEALTDCLLQFRERGPEEDELARARARFRLGLEFERDSLEAQLDRYAWPLLYAAPRKAEVELARIEALTAAQVRELAAHLFERSRLHLVLVGPRDGEAEKAVGRALRRW